MSAKLETQLALQKIGEWKVKTMEQVGAALRRKIRQSLKTGRRMNVNNAPSFEMSHALFIREKIDKALGNARNQSGLWVPSLPGQAPRVSGPNSLLRQIIFKVAPDGNSVKVGPIGGRDVVPQLLEKGGQKSLKVFPTAYARLGVDIVETEGERVFGRVVGEEKGVLRFYQVSPSLPKAGRKNQFLRFIQAAKAKVQSVKIIRKAISIKARPFLQPALDSLSKDKGFEQLLKNTKVFNG